MSPSSFQSLLLLLTLLYLSSTISLSSDYTTLVFKGCADQNFQNYDSTYRQPLTSLLNTLLSQSSSTKFYSTNSSTITGLFQCRSDLSNDDCNSCVSKTPAIAQRLCGQAVAARVQLTGCYLRYEVAGFRQVSGAELLYKVCGSTRPSGAGFGDRVDSALGEIVKGIGSGNSGGFYTGGYQSVYVLGQCEGDLSSADCVSCVNSAIERSKSECGSSISAQIYLQRCYISYAYYPNGVPAGTGTEQSLSSSPGTGRNTQKTVALVLGGLVGVGLVLSCLLFIKSAFKKKSRASHKFGG